ncbi:MAG TPA: ABC transporter permease [Thermoplasmata archaeon]|nr:ABC transporter permease [Thermoplasmata archaeon]
MGLRSFLVKRAAQTVVTIVVVLVLMFVLFRLMPGDPVSLLIQPGLTPQERDAQRVAYGFARWENAPGVFKSGSFAVPDPGLYAITIDVRDSKGNNVTLHAAYVDPKVFPPGSPILLRGVSAEPSQHVLVGDAVTLSVQPIAPTDVSTFQGWALVTPPSGPVSNVSLTFASGRFSGSYTPTTSGVYAVSFIVQNPATDDTADTLFGFAANPIDIAPFSYVTTEDPRGAVFTAQTPYTRTAADVYVVVQSSQGSLGDLVGHVVTPRGATNEFALTHPLVAVDRPVWEEFWYYLVGMLTGNFGNSFQSGRPVSSEIRERVGPTLLLFGSATIVSVLIGIGGGVLLAWFRGSRGEIAAIVSSLFFYSMPIFWFGLILLFVFAYTFRLFPIGGFGGVDAFGNSLTGLSYARDVLWHMALPLANLVILNFAGYVLLMRNSLLEVLGEDFVTVARAKGLKERTVMYKHAARNAMLPVTTVTAIAMATVISGGILTETIFSWPGMGFYFVTRTLFQDFPAVQGAFFILALLTVLGNVVADVAYAYLDPRVRL